MIALALFTAKLLESSTVGDETYERTKEAFGGEVDHPGLTRDIYIRQLTHLSRMRD